MEIDSITDESIQLGKERVEGAVSFGGDGQRDAFKETVAVAVEFDLASFFFGRLECQRLSIPRQLVIVITCAGGGYEWMRHQLADLFSAFLWTTFFTSRIAWSI